jgi:digeranylgeranylglycerophospholipid reductase
VLRYLFDRFQNDAAFDLLLGTAPMRAAASMIYFHRKGVFNSKTPT